MNYSSLELAFLGDSVFELKIRQYFLESGMRKVKNLQNACSKYASAKGHHQIISYLLENELLTEEEVGIYKTGRNSKVNQKRKNFNSEFYHASTGFEALIGYLYVLDQDDRINELINIIVNEVK